MIDSQQLTSNNIDWMFKNIEIDKLNDWELTFIESIEEQFRNKGNLTHKQIETFCKIWNKQE